MFRRLRFLILLFALSSLAFLPSCGELNLNEALQTLGKIGKDGGKLCVGEICMNFPASALPKDLEIQARKLVVSAEHFIEGVNIHGPIYEFKTAVKSFEKPVTLTLPVPEGAKADELMVLRRRDKNSPWMRVPATLSNDKKTLQVKTLHFSFWGTFSSGSHERGDSPILPIRPTDIAFGKHGRIHVVDRYYSRVIVMDRLDGENWFAVSAEDRRSTVGFNPVGLAIGPSGRTYIADADSGKVLALDLIIAEIRGEPVVSPDTKKNQIKRPSGIAIGSDGKIYVLELANSRIVRMDDLTGKNLKTFGSRGNGKNQFNRPDGIAIGPKGKIYVADTDNGRIVMMDDITGKNWKAFGSQGKGRNQFSMPKGLTVGPDGKIYVADTKNDRIVVMDDITGKNWKTLQFERHVEPHGVTIGPKGKIYVASVRGSYISVHSYPPEFASADFALAMTKKDAKCFLEDSDNHWKILHPEAKKPEPPTSFTGVLYKVGTEVYAIGVMAILSNPKTYTTVNGCILKGDQICFSSKKNLKHKEFIKLKAIAADCQK